MYRGGVQNQAEKRSNKCLPVGAGTEIYFSSDEGACLVEVMGRKETLNLKPFLVRCSTLVCPRQRDQLGFHCKIRRKAQKVPGTNLVCVWDTSGVVPRATRPEVMFIRLSLPE